VDLLSEDLQNVLSNQCNAGSPVFHMLQTAAITRRWNQTTIIKIKYAL